MGSVETWSKQSDGAQLECQCGHSIYCDVRHNGDRLGFLAFFDAQEFSETYGEQLANCPECGAWLGVHLLLRAAR